MKKLILIPFALWFISCERTRIHPDTAKIVTKEKNDNGLCNYKINGFVSIKSSLKDDVWLCDCPCGKYEINDNPFK